MTSRAYQPLARALKCVLPPERAELVDEKGYAEAFEDNLVASLAQEQIEELRAQLAAGGGHELDPRDDETRPGAHAAHSSAALAFNSFGVWLGREEELVIDGVAGFTDRLQVEARQPIFRGGCAPNLDCLATGPDVVVGVESKLTETLARHRPTPWSDAYGRWSCRALLTDGWLEALDAARTREYTPEHLDIDQLIKHALGLTKQHPGLDRHLAYVYWEPVNGDELASVRTHRQEVQALVDRIGDASPRLHTLTHTELWSEWEHSAMPWLSTHLGLLRQRYQLAVHVRSDAADSIST